MEKTSLDKFGNFIVSELFDKGIECFLNLKNDHYKSLDKLELQKKLKKFDEEQMEIIQELFIQTLLTSTHDFLFALEERSDLEEDIKVFVDGKNIVKESDGMQGELFAENGWLFKHSKYKKMVNRKKKTIYVK